MADVSLNQEGYHGDFGTDPLPVAEQLRELIYSNRLLAQRLAVIRKLVDEQAEDEGLWFIAHTAPEAYLQQELRRLHAAIEGRST